MIVELEHLTIRDLIERSFKRFADLDCLAFVGETPRSYKRIAADVEALAKRLAERGIGPGDKVAILGENSPNWVVAYLAVTSSAVVSVPILPNFPEGDIRHIIRDSGATAVFVTSKLRPVLDDLGKSELHTVFLLDDLSEESLKPSPKKTKTADRETQAGGWLSGFATPKPEDLAAIIYTSGTTGHSKGVMLTHGNITSDVVNALEKFPLDTNDRFLSILPLSHTFEATGGMLCPLATGVSIYYMQGLPTPQKLLSSMESAKPTGVLTVPLVMDKIYRKRILPQIQSKKMLNTLYAMPVFRKKLNKVAGKKLIKSLGGQLRFFMFGGAALNEDVEVFLRDAGIQYSTGYGMTETSPIMTINPFGKVRVGSCGQPIPGIQIQIHEPDPETGIGEIVVKGPIVMQGYYNNSKATSEVFLENGWLRTGDLGYFDKEGYLFIKGRSKHVIVGPSGENIYPEIIEQKLQQNPFVQQAIVYTVEEKLTVKVYLDPDILDQEMKKAGVVPDQVKGWLEELLETIRKTTNLELPSFSTIQRITRQSEPFEMTPTNKVKRYLYV